MKMTRPTYHGLPIIAVKYLQGVRTNHFMIDVLLLWRRKRIKVYQHAFLNGTTRLQIHRMIGSLVDINNPVFIDGAILFPTWNSRGLNTGLETFPIKEEFAGSFLSEENELSTSDERTRRMYYYQKACKQPEDHGRSCRCKSFSEFELPLSVQIADWVSEVI